MPVAVLQIQRNADLLRQMAAKQHQAMQKIQEFERLAALGQLASGVAHELNNAITVLSLGTRWLSESIAFDMTLTGGIQNLFFDAGLKEGRTLSSTEARNLERLLTSELGFSPETARRLAATGISADALRAIPRHILDDADELHERWETGATLHDMALAARQAEHVIATMKSLGNCHGKTRSHVQVNDSVRVALALCRSQCRDYDIELDLNELPTVDANLGDLVQIWSNLIRNACEALASEPTEQPRIHVSTYLDDDAIVVSVADNGPGIPDDLRPHIFEPNVTTRGGGLACGFGLGLSIVRRLITEYHGAVEVDSSPAGTTMAVRLPV